MTESFIPPNSTVTSSTTTNPGAETDETRNLVKTSIGSVSVSTSRHPALSPASNSRVGGDGLLGIDGGAPGLDARGGAEDEPTSMEARRLLDTNVAGVHRGPRPNHIHIARFLANKPVLGHVLLATPLIGGWLESRIKPVTQSFGRPDRAFVETMKARKAGQTDASFDMDALKAHEAGRTNKSGTYYQESQGLNARCAEHAANAMMGGHFLTREDIDAAYNDYNAEYPFMLETAAGKQGSRMKGYLRRTAQIALARKGVKTVGDDLFMAQNSDPAQRAHDRAQARKKLNHIDGMVKANDPDRMMIAIRKKGNVFKRMLGIDSMHWVTLRRDSDSGKWTKIDSQQKVRDAVRGHQPSLGGDPVDYLRELATQDDVIAVSVIMPHSDKAASTGQYMQKAKEIHDRIMPDQRGYDEFVLNKDRYRSAISRLSSILNHGVPVDPARDAEHVRALRASADEMEEHFADMKIVADIRDLATALETACTETAEAKDARQVAGGNPLLTDWTKASQAINEAGTGISSQELWDVSATHKNNADSLKGMGPVPVKDLAANLETAREEIRQHGAIRDPQLARNIKTNVNRVLEGWNRYGLPEPSAMHDDRGKAFINNLLAIQSWASELDRLVPTGSEDRLVQAFADAEESNAQQPPEMAAPSSAPSQNVANAGGITRDEAQQRMRSLEREFDPFALRDIPRESQPDIGRLNISESELLLLASDIDAASQQITATGSLTNSMLRNRIANRVENMLDNRWNGSQPPNEDELQSTEAKQLLRNLIDLKEAIEVL